MENDEDVERLEVLYAAAVEAGRRQRASELLAEIRKADRLAFQKPPLLIGSTSPVSGSP